jgi:excisionase family DNA binding protein
MRERRRRVIPAVRKISQMQVVELAYSVSEACRIAHVGRTSLYDAIHRGELRAVKRGRRTLILRSDLIRWLQSLPPLTVKGVEQSNAERNTNHG